MSRLDTLLAIFSDLDRLAETHRDLKLWEVETRLTAIRHRVRDLIHQEAVA